VVRATSVALLVLLVAPRPATADADALWHIVGERCVPDETQNHSPRPCEQVDLIRGYAVLKDIVGDTQFLLIPTTRISGIESPAILAPDAPNYFAAAWRARHYVDDRVHHTLPRQVIGLAINSINGRTQNQLHIHIDCMRLDVIAALRDHASAIDVQWSKFPVPFAGHPYMAMRLEQSDLGQVNPFSLLADGIPDASTDMADYTLVVVGASFGFVVLADHANPATGDRGSGEELQDHACAAANAAAQ
jgi:CDP-diacylglycerol pyrophosphatase